MLIKLRAASNGIEMTNTSKVVEKALAAMRGEPRVGPHFKPDALAIDAEGTATLQGEVDNVAVKRLALERLAATAGVTGVIDRLHVKPASRMSDDGILDHLLKAYYEEPAFLQLRLVEREQDVTKLVRDVPAGARGTLEIEVDDGIVILNGSVPSLASKRLAGVLAWWVPGSRDVINGIAVEPPEEDKPIEIEEAVRIALEKDPLLDASQIKVGVRERSVRLTGLVRSDTERDAAEWDSWYVFGVDNVINEIEVSA